MRFSTVPFHRAGFAAAAFALVLTTAGCGKIAEKAAEKATEKAIEAGTGGKVDIDGKNGSFKIETDEGSMTFDADEKSGGMSIETKDGSFRSGSEIPDTWPGDVPLPPGMEVVSGHSMDADERKTSGVTGRVDASPEQVMAFFTDALSAWEQVSTASMDGDHPTRHASWELDGRTLTIGAVHQDGDTVVNLVHVEGRS